MLNKEEPKKGSLLISEPFMLDPNFSRAVVLLCEHEYSGTIGLVVNQKSNFQVQDIMPDMEGVDFPVFIGGPVGIENLQFIHKCFDRLDSGYDLGEGVYWGGDFEMLKLLIDQNSIQKGEIKFFIGYSGWDPEQLKSELQENTWMVNNDFNPDLLFVDDEDNIWKEAIINLGPKYAHVANFPKNPALN